MQKMLFAPLYEMDAMQSLDRAARRREICAVHGLGDSARLHVSAALGDRLSRPLLFITANEASAQRAADDLQSLLPGRVRLFPARQISLHRISASSRDISIRRLEALGALIAGEAAALVMPIDALMHRLMPKDRFVKAMISMEAGDVFDLPQLLLRLVESGYERVDMVEGRGQFAQHGGILDIYPVGMPGAYRVEFFDDEVDTIREIDTLSQRTVARVDKISIYPAGEALLHAEQVREAYARFANAIETEEAQEDLTSLNPLPDLPPWEDLEEEDADELPGLWEMGANSSKAGHQPPVGLAFQAGGQRAQKFAGRLERLLSDGTFEGIEAFMPLLYPQVHTLMEYAAFPLVVLDQPSRLAERCENVMLEFQEHFKSALTDGEALPPQGELLIDYEQIVNALCGGTVLTLDPFARINPLLPPEEIVKFEVHTATSYQGNLKEAEADMRKWLAEGYTLAVLAGGAARARRLYGTLTGHGVDALLMEEEAPRSGEGTGLKPGKALLMQQALNRGFVCPQIRFAVLTETDLFGMDRQKSKTRRTPGQRVAAFTDLAAGDYVVHESHGVGIYMGTTRLQNDGTYRDYLHIQYQGSDKLYLPTDQLDRIQKYIGGDGNPPRLNKLSGGEWQRQKAKVKASIREMADELVKLYAARSTVKGHAYGMDTPWQREFEELFPYEETPDQLQSTEEIKHDMERPIVMDRLLCGDVGYGKTEVALRAAFKAVMDGKQVALLAPTTILVQQHVNTIRQRFANFPVKVESLSRFRSAAEQKLVLKALREGEVDILVGTHRMLSKEVMFSDLGLLIIDEEQRFGVRHKEKIKQMKQAVDVLTLSATPIPRTLHMSMVGIRDMSLLESPPEERYPVQTYVMEYTDSLVRDAILREVGRGGQVYFLYNRVSSIDNFALRLRALMPDIRIAVAHGQMRENALEDVMMDFYEGKYDVLLCTTIIESGLDVQRANTLIVFDADRFGLSQLYQLRGRVGRSNRLAYAYFTIRQNKVITETAEKRLQAIREFTEFGSGFRVAMRDLEIRGAGNLLGSEQHGHMASVGYDLYVKMIEETVRELRGELPFEDVETRMEIPVNAYLPNEYVGNDFQRIDAYKRIASIKDRATREDVLEELIDRFGDPTHPVVMLVDIAHLKGLCGRLKIDQVTYRQRALNMRFSKHASFELMALVRAMEPYQKELTLSATQPPSLILRGSGDAEELLARAVAVMEKIVDGVFLQGESESA